MKGLLEARAGQPIRLGYLPMVSVDMGDASFVKGSIKAPKGKVFVALLLGVEDKAAGVTLDPTTVLNAMGWFFQPDPDEAHRPNDDECACASCTDVKTPR